MIVTDSHKTFQRVQSVLRTYAKLAPSDTAEDRRIRKDIYDLCTKVHPVVLMTEGTLYLSELPGRTDYRGMTRTYMEDGVRACVIHLPPRADDATVLHELVHAAGYGERAAYRIGDDYRRRICYA